MRVFLRDSERRPDPVPVKTDDRRPILIGLAVWVIATIVVVLFFAPMSGSGNSGPASSESCWDSPVWFTRPNDRSRVPRRATCLRTQTERSCSSSGSSSV
jgi:hypothetical protein